MSRRNKRIRLYVGHDGLEVVTPPGVSAKRAEEVLLRFADWVLDRLNALDRTPEPTRLFLRGRELDVRVEVGEPRVEVSDGRVTVWTHRERPPRSVLAEWLGDEAGRDIIARLEVQAPKLNVSWRMVYVKDQKTLWGSCTGRDNLCFNYRLVMAPPEVLDYVVMHEVAHLVHRNHSKAFWSVVAKLCPEYRERVRWLKQHGPSLRLPKLPAAPARHPEPSLQPPVLPHAPQPSRASKPSAPNLQLDLPW